MEAVGSRRDDAAAGANQSRTPRGPDVLSVGPASHLGCPYCCNYEVDRLYIGSAGIDSCVCRACGAEWDEVEGSGEVKGRSRSHSALLHH